MHEDLAAQKYTFWAKNVSIFIEVGVFYSLNMRK